MYKRVYVIIHIYIQGPPLYISIMQGCDYAFEELMKLRYTVSQFNAFGVGGLSAAAHSLYAKGNAETLALKKRMNAGVDVNKTVGTAPGFADVYDEDIFIYHGEFEFGVCVLCCVGVRCFCFLCFCFE